MLRQLKASLRSRLKPVVAKYKRAHSAAKFIGVTGSSAKSTTLALLSHILAHDHKTFRQVLSNQMINLEDGLSRITRDTDYFLMEAGASGPGSIGPMAELLRPDVALITLINLEHYSAFRSKAAIADEKARLVEMVPAEGLVLLNADDAFTDTISKRVQGRIVTFGRSERADYRVLETGVRYPETLRLRIGWRGGIAEVKTNFIAEPFWLSSVAAFATAVELGTDPAAAIERIASFAPLINRCGVLEAPGGPRFILDTAKAPWESLMLSLDMLRHPTGCRKRLILGHISDYAGNSRSKYRDAYRAAREIFDEVIFVGDNAHRSMASDEDRETGRFREFHSVEKLASYIRETAVPGEIILIKGSQNLHLERIALAWDDGVECWKETCGRWSCFQCGCYPMPYDLQKQRKVRKRRRKKTPGALRSGFVDIERV